MLIACHLSRFIFISSVLSCSNIVFIVLLICVCGYYYLFLRCMRSYALGAGPITYQSYDDRHKKETNNSDETTAAEKGGRDDDKDKSLTDLRLAFEYTKVEYAMTNTKLHEAVRLALQERKYFDVDSATTAADVNKDSLDDSMDKAFVKLNLDERSEVVAAALSFLLGAEIIVGSER